MIMTRRLRGEYQIWMKKEAVASFAFCYSPCCVLTLLALFIDQRDALMQGLGIDGGLRPGDQVASGVYKVGRGD